LNYENKILKRTCIKSYDSNLSVAYFVLSRISSEEKRTCFSYTDSE